MTTTDSKPTTTDTAHTAVLETAHHYIDGWFTGDGQRMARALHPALVKRSIRDTEGKGELWTLTRDEMIAATAGGGGVADAAKQIIEIDDVRVDGDIASARVVSTAFIDYLHFIREDASWRIVNAVWRAR